MGSVLFVLMIVVMLLLVPTCAAIYIYYEKSRMTTEEWAQLKTEQDKRLKEAQKNPMYWSMHL